MPYYVRQPQMQLDLFIVNNNSKWKYPDIMTFLDFSHPETSPQNSITVLHIDIDPTRKIASACFDIIHNGTWEQAVFQDNNTKECG